MSETRNTDTLNPMFTVLCTETYLYSRGLYTSWYCFQFGKSDVTRLGPSIPCGTVSLYGKSDVTGLCPNIPSLYGTVSLYGKSDVARLHPNIPCGTVFLYGKNDVTRLHPNI